tara:strand:+ start:99940 stop:100728 length:789 start_codon:yes stop_codon:yes gene_type:complete
MGDINKIVHFSDLHLKLFKQHELYKTQLKKCFEKWSELKPDRIVFTGDLVHSKNQITPELINLVSWVMIECAKICKSVFLVGNHDFLENNHNRLDALTPIVENLNNPNVVYYKDEGVYEDENVEWVVYSLYNDNQKPNMVDTTTKHRIGLYHGAIRGLTTDLGFEFDTANDVSIFKGLDVVLAGDIHKRQILDIPNNKKAYMVGSLIQQNFGENIKNHGFGVYEIETQKYYFVDIKNPEPFLTFKIKDITDIENEKEKLTNR